MSKKPNGPSRRTKDPKKRVNQDLRRFKARFHAMINQTKIVWEGPPYAVNSVYRFQLPTELFELVIGIIARSQSDQANKATLKAANAVNDALESESDAQG